MSTYLACPHKKNKPRIAVEVCQHCRRRRGCKAYSTYQNPKLFEDARPGRPQGTSS
jgi:hypothetical protein